MTALRRFVAGLAVLAATALPAQAIVGSGGDAAPFSPFVVMVLNHVGRVAGYCSGLVVAQDAVLTAAHCMPAGAALKVHYRDPSGAPVLADVAAVSRNPGFRSDAIKARQRSIDLAIVRLAAPLPARFRPVRIEPLNAAPAGTAFTLAGFGLSREGDPTSSGTLRTADVVARDPVSDVLLWARDPKGAGAGACTGDSGGPVFAAGGVAAVALMAWSAGEGKAACGALTQAVWLGPSLPWIDATLAAWGVSRER